MARPRGALVAVSALGSWVIRGPWELWGLYLVALGALGALGAVRALGAHGGALTVFK